MKRKFVTLPLLIIGLLSLFALRSHSQELTAEKSNALQKCVKDFLAGNGCEDVFACTFEGKFQQQPPDAQRVRALFEHSQVVFGKIIVLNNGDAVVLGTTKVDQGLMDGKPLIFQFAHTFVLQEKQPKQWKVKIWHSSYR